jgi:hypothetical protein
MRINDTEIEEYKELIKNANVYNLSGLYATRAMHRYQDL